MKETKDQPNWPTPSRTTLTRKTPTNQSRIPSRCSVRPKATSGTPNPQRSFLGQVMFDVLNIEKPNEPKEEKDLTEETCEIIKAVHTEGDRGREEIEDERGADL